MHYFKLLKLESRKLIDDMAINCGSPWNFVSMKIYMKIMLSNGRFIKIHIELRNIELDSNYT